MHTQDHVLLLIGIFFDESLKQSGAGVANQGIVEIPRDATEGLKFFKHEHYLAVWAKHYNVYFDYWCVLNLR